MKNTFFNGMVFYGQKDLFQRWLRASPSCQLYQTYRFIIFDSKGKFLFINKYFQEFLTGKSFNHCMFRLTLQIDLYDQNLVRKKEDFDFKSDFI